MKLLHKKIGNTEKNNLTHEKIYKNKSSFHTVNISDIVQGDGKYINAQNVNNKIYFTPNMQLAQKR